MKSHFLALLFSFSASAFLFADCSAHKLVDAQTQAAADKKSVLLVFAGGKWHEPSQKFREEILNDKEMKKKLGEHFIIHVLEYPKKNEGADDTLKSLREKYRVSRFPTVLLTDPLGRPFGYTGYRAGGSENMMKSITEARELLSKRDAAFAVAYKTKGVPRAQALEEGLRLLPQSILREHYATELDAIKKADPKGETKLLGELEKSEALQKEREAYSALYKEKKFDEVIKKSRDAAAQAKGEDAQRLSMYAIQALVSQKKYAEATKAIEAMAELAPETNYGKSAERYKKVVANVKDRDGRASEAKKAQPRKPVVSKPVAVVSDIKALEDDLKKLRDELSTVAEKAKKVTAAESDAAKKIAALEKELKALKGGQDKRAEEAKKARAEQLRLTKKEKLLSEVIENHHAMEKRKREISDLEKKAADLQEKAEEMRKKARNIKSGQ